MNRELLLEKLDIVAPALSKTNLVPVLSHFWFTNGGLMAYNDLIAISTKLDTEFIGAVPGSTLMALLEKSKAKDVEFVTGKDGNKKLPEGQLLVKAASSKFTLPYLEEEKTHIFEMPEEDLSVALPVDLEAFLDAIEICMISLKEDPAIPDSLGITLMFGPDYIDIYTTNDATITKATVSATAYMYTQPIVLSGSFCRQMLSLAKKGGKKHLEIREDYSLFECGDIILFGKLVQVQKPLDFAGAVDNAFPVEMEEHLVSIPSKLELILDRAIVIGDPKKPKTQVTIKNNIVQFYTQSERGEVRDSMQLEEHVHPDVTVYIDPRLWKVGYGKFDSMLLTEKCLVMSSPDSLYLVSASV
jgi:DNA polymerase III sliding clamp (beta) subunit (PCNA family)